MEKFRTPTLITILLLVIILIGIGLFGRERKSNVIVSKETSDGITFYENHEYGFSLELPREWKDVKIVPSSREPEHQYDEVSNQDILVEQRQFINFLLKTVDGSYAPVFILNIHPQTEWQEIGGKAIFSESDNPEGGIKGGFLGENSKYAYTYIIGEGRENFVGFEPPNTDMYYGPHEDALNKIVPTFKITSL